MPSPTHYAIVLKQSFPLPDGSLVVPAGASIVSKVIADQIPAEIIASKTSMKAGEV